MVVGTAGTLGSANLEAVREATVDVSEVLHTAGASGLTSLGLLAPVDCSKVPCKPNQFDIQIMGDDRWQFHKQREDNLSRREGIRTLASLSGGVATSSTAGLLDVEAAAA